MAKRVTTKDKIKAEALNLFSTDGYAGGSVRDISKRAGVRESALYNYFASKEGILVELIKEAKKHSIGANLLSDELLEELKKPKFFLKKFIDVLFAHWNNEEQKKYLRLILIEQFRNKSDDNVSINLLIEDIVNICEMIFSQMKKFKFIKSFDSKTLADEFVSHLFMMRLQFLTADKVNWKELKSKSEKHLEYFWNLAKR